MSAPAGAGPAWPARVDVAIVGGGLAGQSLARQLLLETSRSVLLVERLASLPPQAPRAAPATAGGVPDLPTERLSPK